MISLPRNIWLSMLGGTLFSIAWWMLFDAANAYINVVPGSGYMWPIIGGTIGLITTALIPLHSNSMDTIYKCSHSFLKFSLMITLMISFGMVIWATYMWTADYLMDSTKPVWPGIALFLQNILILATNLTLKFGRTEIL